MPGEVTSCSSALFTDPTGPGREPARRPAWLAARFLRLGAHCGGRTHMNEFAYGLDGRNAHTGDCPLPLDGKRISGGSSSGSAWAVAAGVVPVALGTDTGGSIRLPAALCGIYGYRMAYGAARLSGVFPLARSMDTVGWFTATAGDMAELLDLFSETKGTPAEGGGASKTAALSVGAVVPPGVVPDEEVATRWEAALEASAAAGGVAQLVRLSPPAVLGDPAWKAYNVIGSHEAWSAHEAWLDRYRSSYDPAVWSLIDRGRHWTEERLREARSIREEVRTCVADWFRAMDVVLIPATPSASPLADGADGRFREGVIRLNAPVSLAGSAALSIPIAHDAVRSSGLQVLVPSGCEERLTRFLTVWETVVG
ncbi:MAG: amidase [Spirochaetales bacterium]|nr:amidase [Spirochaetales bacterium]